MECSSRCPSRARRAGRHRRKVQTLELHRPRELEIARASLEGQIEDRIAEAHRVFQTARYIGVAALIIGLALSTAGNLVHQRLVNRPAVRRPSGSTRSPGHQRVHRARAAGRCPRPAGARRCRGGSWRRNDPVTPNIIADPPFQLSRPAGGPHRVATITLTHNLTKLHRHEVATVGPERPPNGDLPALPSRTASSCRPATAREGPPRQLCATATAESSFRTGPRAAGGRPRSRRRREHSDERFAGAGLGKRCGGHPPGTAERVYDHSSHGSGSEAARSCSWSRSRAASAASICSG